MANSTPFTYYFITYTFEDFYSENMFDFPKRSVFELEAMPKNRPLIKQFMQPIVSLGRSVCKVFLLSLVCKYHFAVGTVYNVNCLHRLVIRPQPLNIFCQR